MKNLQDINDTYIKDIFLFFSEEYSKMYKNPNKVKELIEHQIESRLYNNNLIHNWRIIMGKDYNKSEWRDIQLEQLLNNEVKEEEPIIINFYYQQNKASEIKIIDFILK
jgi:hypothetical protein